MIQPRSQANLGKRDPPLVLGWLASVDNWISLPAPRILGRSTHGPGLFAVGQRLQVRMVEVVLEADSSSSISISGLIMPRPRSMPETSKTGNFQSEQMHCPVRGKIVVSSALLSGLARSR
jgi:hypothetical protein